MQHRIQLDDNYQARLEAIQQSTHLDTNEIIKQAIDLLYEKTALTAIKKNQRLIKMLSGIGHGPTDGSVRYKEYVAEYLDEKFSHR